MAELKENPKAELDELYRIATRSANTQKGGFERWRAFELIFFSGRSYSKQLIQKLYSSNLLDGGLSEHTGFYETYRERLYTVNPGIY